MTVLTLKRLVAVLGCGDDELMAKWAVSFVVTILMQHTSTEYPEPPTPIGAS